MGAAANLTLKNKANADVVFEPYMVEGDTAVYVNRTPGAVNAWHWLRLKRTRPTNLATGVTRIRYEFEYPTVDPTTKKVLYVNRHIGEYYEPTSASLTNNGDIHAYVKSFLATTVALDAAESGVIPT